MSEKKGIIGYLASISSIYEMFQTIVGGNETRNIFAKEFVNCEKFDNVLDFGAGTGRIINSLPSVNYFAYEPKKSYHTKIILNAKKTNSKIKIVDSFESLRTYKNFFNIIIMSGVIHHLDKNEFKQIAGQLIPLLAPNGRIVTIDPVFSPNITFFNKLLNKIDRGNHIKEKNIFENLIENTFKLKTHFYYRDNFNLYFKFLQCISISSK